MSQLKPLTALTCDTFLFTELGSFRGGLWDSDFFNNLFKNYTDRGKMIVNAIAYPIYMTHFLTTNYALAPDQPIYVGDERMPNQRGVKIVADYANDTTLCTYTFGANLNNTLTNTFLDYTTITEYKLYVPFVGAIDIDYDTLVSGFTIKYYLDITTGTLSIDICVPRGEEIAIIQNFTAQLAEPISFSSGDAGVFRDKVIKAMEIVGSIAAAYATSGASSATHSVTKQGATKTTIAKSGGTTTIKHGASQVVRDSTTSTARHVSQYAAVHAVNSIGDLMSMRGSATINKSPSLGGLFGVDLEPKVFYKRPYKPDLANFAYVEGRPLNEIKKLRDLVGYTEVSNVRLQLPSYSGAYGEELEEIERLLSEGFYINAH